MSEKLFLQFPDIKDINNCTEMLLWFYVVDDQVQKNGDLLITELSQLKDNFPSLSTQLIVLVPAIDCLVTQVAIPSRQKRQQLKAIPFALEEQLADDIEDMHFAIGKRKNDGQLPVVAVSKTKVDNWLQILNAAGISASAMMPLSGLLEAPEKVWSIYHIDDEFLVNQDGNCWIANAVEAAMMLQLSIQQIEDEELPKLLYWGMENAPGWISGLGLEFSEHQVQNSRQSLLNRFDYTQTNLLQGDFEIRDDWLDGWNIWRKAAIIATLAILLKFSLMGFDLYRLSAEKQYLKEEITRVYHQVAPGARMTAYPERQMRQLLARSQGGSNQSGTFMVMVSKLAEGLNAIPNIRPTNLHYDSSRSEIRLDLLVSNLPVLDQLKDTLAAKGLSVEVGGASAQGKDYSGRLIIRSDS